MIEIHALKKFIKSGTFSYPIFIGFLTAKELIKIAEAPSFTGATTHEQIAHNVLTPPTKEWQRPLDSVRIQRIASVFNDTGEFMPNPVLLSQNGLEDPGLQPEQVVVNGVATDAWTIEVPVPQGNDPRPLWILDGQHRISGLAQSSQLDNPIPLVLLLNADQHEFSDSQLAKIFAQVTTEAEKLDPLHDEWLTFAFKLKTYDPSDPNHIDQCRSMESVALLCKDPHLNPGDPANPFYNKIQFRPGASPKAPKPGGFVYTCDDLRKIIFSDYYNCVCTSGNHLTPHALARQIVAAHGALAKVVSTAHNKSVFFGAGDYGQKIMQDAWLAGVLTYLLNHGLPNNGKEADWVAVLQNLVFNTSDWNFNSWVVGLSGRANSRSKKLARNVMCTIFRNRAVPSGTTDLANYFQGDSAEIELTFCELTPKNRPSKKNKLVTKYSIPGTKSASISPRRHVKMTAVSDNIADIKVTDGTILHGETRQYIKDLRKGFVLDTQDHQMPLKLEFTIEFYGETKGSLKLNLQW